MATFRSKPVLIDAEQFFHDQPLPFHTRGPYVAFNGEFFYVTTNQGNRAGLRDVGGRLMALDLSRLHVPTERVS